MNNRLIVTTLFSCFASTAFSSGIVNLPPQAFNLQNGIVQSMGYVQPKEVTFQCPLPDKCTMSFNYTNLPGISVAGYQVSKDGKVNNANTDMTVDQYFQDYLNQNKPYVVIGSFAGDDKKMFGFNVVDSKIVGDNFVMTYKPRTDAEKVDRDEKLADRKTFIDVAPPKEGTYKVSFVSIKYIKQ